VTAVCVVEGALRALDAAYSERMLGMAFVALPWRAVVAAKGVGATPRGRLGPTAPTGDRGKAGAPSR
jgi:hypothetical protein